ncbi:MAG: polysaccharide biosynthesis protein [Gammaproteobacteria bacterium]|nr:polysaccharide biosynthesis protein [Gammaproteobacteria bacterium]
MFQSLLKDFLDLSRTRKRLVVAGADLVIVFVSIWAAFSLRLDVFYVPSTAQLWIFLVAPLIAIPVFIRFGLYRAIIRYIGFQALWTVFRAVMLYALIWSSLVLLSGVSGVPRSVYIINLILVMLLVGGSRMAARWIFTPHQGNRDRRFTDNANNVVIYGAGSAGFQLASALSYSSDQRAVAFIDDALSLHNQQLNGLKIHPFSHLSHLIEKLNVKEVLLALPSASRSRRREIIAMLEPYPVHVRTLPGLSAIANGEVKIEDISEVSIEDLLGRDVVPPNKELLGANITGKVVMVTGAGGSIGSELCRQIVQLSPARLILLEQHEYALYAMENELLNWAKMTGSVLNEDSILPVLASVTDLDRLELVCHGFGVQTIYHTAAYKHVPMVERNPVEAIDNNIFGTLRAAQAAINCGVEAFVLISTDKAVRPTNTMGASKRFAELILQGLAGLEGKTTRFTMVRFGNVLGSSGSVVPLFREQIRNGGPVTVTDPKMIRYFMTIPEASQLVIQAGAMGTGGDVFVLDMGEPIRIMDMARRMIRLSGLDVRDEEHPDGDIEIQFTGLRPGEKLYEELLIGDNPTPTEHALIMRAEEEILPWEEIEKLLQQFELAAKMNDANRVRELLLSAVSGFSPQCDVEDVVTKFGKDKIPGMEILNFHKVTSLKSEVESQML